MHVESLSFDAGDHLNEYVWFGDIQGVDRWPFLQHDMRESTEKTNLVYRFELSAFSRPTILYRLLKNVCQSFKTPSSFSDNPE